MKNIIIAAVIASAAITSCKKSETVVPTNTQAAYTIDGIHEVSVNRAFDSRANSVSMPLTVSYRDSAQQEVSVAISGVPSFIFCGTVINGAGFATTVSPGPWVGYPSFGIPLIFYVTDNNAYTVGFYPITLTSTCKGVVKTFTFKLACN